ncbi:MAG: 4-(cytidine 5'-diphospho)-2-C-methyl-D-erythritol kinase [Alphaproteobacteria bacterium]
MSAAGAPITLAARGKLNLYLHVTGRRADGLHNLDSLVAFAELADTLTVRPAKELSLAVDGPFAAALGPVEDNLVLRAARALATAGRVPAAAEIRLGKRLPVAAGLGGGSADAAAALKALARLWRIDGVDIAGLAAGLGADVPACLAGVPAFIAGAGEEVSPAPALPPAGVLLVNPGVALATPEVFAARRGAYSAADRFAAAPQSVGDLAAVLRDRRNDLTQAAVQLCPQVAEVLETLAAAPGCRLARMSGSGATCFGLFDDRRAAAGAAPALARPGWWLVPTRLVSLTRNSIERIPGSKGH